MSTRPEWLKPIGSLDLDSLLALSLMLATMIAAREAAERLGVSVSAEIIDDEDGSSLVITPASNGGL